MTRTLGTRTIICPECGATVTGVMGNRRRFCSEPCASIARKRSRPKAVYRHLAPGEALPDGKPLRYRTPHGYIQLRWTVAPSSFVEVGEHRVVDGRNSTAEHVHHINFIRDDNRRENLLEVTIEEHQAIHKAEDRRRHREMKEMYEQGYSTVQIANAFGTHAGNVYRGISRQGATIRTASDYARAFDPPVVAARYLSGEGATAIAADLHVSLRRVHNALRASGIQLRGSGRVPRKVA